MAQLKIKSDSIVNISIFIVIFIASLSIIPYYTEGDQEKYIKVYDISKNYSLIDGFRQYILVLSAAEPVHYFISYSASSLNISKNILISLSNAFLSLFFCIYMRKKNVNYIVLFLIVISNFYFIAVYTALERLKFSLIFLLLSLIFIENKKLLIVLSILSIVSHLQILILYCSFILLYLSEKIFHRITIKYIFNSLLLFFSAILLFFIMRVHILKKFFFYANLDNLYDVLPSMFLLLVSLFYSKSLKEVFIIFIPILISISIFGGGRLNILAYFIFLYFALPIRNGFNMGVFITTIYFSYKSYEFVENILLFGRGYN